MLDGDNPMFKIQILGISWCLSKHVHIFGWCNFFRPGKRIGWHPGPLLHLVWWVPGVLSTVVGSLCDRWSAFIRRHRSKRLHPYSTNTPGLTCCNYSPFLRMVKQSLTRSFAQREKYTTVLNLAGDSLIFGRCANWSLSCERQTHRLVLKNVISVHVYSLFGLMISVKILFLLIKHDNRKVVRPVSCAPYLDKLL